MSRMSELHLLAADFFSSDDYRVTSLTPSQDKQFRDLTNALWDGVASEREYIEVALDIGVSRQRIEQELKLLRTQDGLS